MAFRIAAVLLAVPWLGGCSAECVTEGCDALRERARGDESGIGGVVASCSDVVVNDCHECGFGQTTVEGLEADGSAPLG